MPKTPQTLPLNLVVPDLLPPAGFAPDLPPLPALETLLAKGRLERNAGMSGEDWLLNACQFTSTPIAALLRLAHGLAGDERTWICADPVHLRVERDHLQLVDSHLFRLSADEARALIDSINQHLQQDGLTIEMLAPDNWVMAIPADAVPATTLIWRAAGKSVFDHLPAKAGNIDWKKLGNEIQMLLHDHPVNEARMARGELPVSGVWFWGAGPMPLQGTNYPERIFATSKLARGLALHGESRLAAPPTGFAQLAAEAGGALVMLDDLSDALRRHDVAAWRDAMIALETRWFAPILSAVWTGKLAALRAVFPSEATTLYLHVGRIDLYKLWRRRQPLLSHA